MSIYATIFDLGFNHADRCARIKRLSAKVSQQDDSKPCTCRSAPIRYDGSHLLPSDKDARDGSLDLGAIPGHISHKHRPALSKNLTPWHPWLRVGVNHDTTILDRKQVRQLRDALTQWLRKIAPEPPTSERNRT